MNKEIKEQFILDACCGGRMFWFNKEHPNTLYIDNRVAENGHIKREYGHSVKPDMVMDFRKLDLPDKSFKLVVFDPPHCVINENCNIAKAFGTLDVNNWQDDIKKGFDECWRVLDDYGVLIFKWNAVHIKVSEILKLIEKQPLFGHHSGKRSETHWLCFMKIKQPYEKQ